MSKFKLLKLNLQFFADDEGGDDAPKFTEEEVQEKIEKAVKARLKRQEAKFTQELEDLKAQLEDKEQQGLPELEKLQKQLEKAQKEADDYKTKYTDLENKNKNLVIQQAFAKEAGKAGIVFVDDAMRLADLTDVEVLEDGSVQGLESVVKTLATEKPYLKKAVPDIGGSANGGNAGADNKNITKEQFMQMKYADRVKLFNSDPELYKELTKQD